MTKPFRKSMRRRVVLFCGTKIVASQSIRVSHPVLDPYGEQYGQTHFDFHNRGKRVWTVDGFTIINGDGYSLAATANRIIPMDRRIRVFPRDSLRIIHTRSLAISRGPQ